MKLVLLLLFLSQQGLGQRLLSSYPDPGQRKEIQFRDLLKSNSKQQTQGPDVRNIDSITILNSVKATALPAPAGENGVRMIRSKKTEFSITIKDAEDSSLLAGISVIIFDNGHRAVSSNKTDAKGTVHFKLPYSKEYEAEISSVGYQSQTILVTGQSCQSIGMKKRFSVMGPVVILGYGSRIIRCGGYCWSIKGLAAQKNTSENSQTISVYPNPSPGSGSIYIRSNLPLKETMKIFNGSGQMVQSCALSNEKLFSVQLHNLPPGHYFLLMQSSEGITHTEKLVIQ
ncbi:MAG: T9SS type A sorting domain-containing protein [Flavisolibacter sp.]